jgi:N-acetylglutamate synthase-like GNAT family acetyltransferase/DNA-binding MarR family transcriptional regulator
MINFYDTMGSTALGSRLRRLSDIFLESGNKIYPMYDVALDPKWFPIFSAIESNDGIAITEIAKIVGQSHVLVSVTVKEMMKKGIVTTTKGEKDGRMTHVSLSPLGKEINQKLQVQLLDVTKAADDLLAEMNYNLLKSIEEMEFLLSRQDFAQRVIAAKRIRVEHEITIIDFTPEHRDAFKWLNYEWITKYFKLEEADHKALDNPEKIIADGGFIFMAVYQATIVGTVALIKMDDDTYELAKMAVSEKAQGKHIGWKLSQACIEKGRAMKAKRLYLESNTILTPAITMYYKLGFERIVGKPSPYERANIQMELFL